MSICVELEIRPTERETGDASRIKKNRHALSPQESSRVLSGVEDKEIKKKKSSSSHSSANINVYVGLNKLRPIENVSQNHERSDLYRAQSFVIHGETLFIDNN